MKKTIFPLALCFLGFSVWAQQDPVVVSYAETIQQNDLKKHLEVIASDAMQGRGTGEVGQKMAAAYIAHHFQQLGLQGPVKGGDNKGFYQPVALYQATTELATIRTAKKTFSNSTQDLAFLGSVDTQGEQSMELVFGGAGKEEDLAGLDLSGKVVLIVSEARGASRLALDKGAAHALVVNKKTDEEFAEWNKAMGHYFTSGRLSVSKPDKNASGTFFIKPSVALEVMGINSKTLQSVFEGTNKKKIKNSTVNILVKAKVSDVPTENVLGYLEGSDKKEELLVITAHYDHVGMEGEEIYNGADDDGSGTVAVLELAEAFAKAKKEGKGPRRSILFMTVTGEEKGLLGSAYYASNPVFPLSNTVVDLNIDMIGRIDPKHEQAKEYVYLVGSDRLSSELHTLSEKANATYTKLELDYTYNDEAHPERIYYRSDHWNFAKNNIPIIFYYNGSHADYHKPTDTVEKIDYEMLQKRAQLVFYTAWEIANRENRLVVDKK
ncbi:M28 family peptidase [Cytophagales bacterium LB-30]|uniref:M28 family peptidase n=1 Tax=Shiella aurantiaca TaxID=3058365 RepID=A0ABT8F5F0_9BACT|nr:M28 family peptidase [Shiella aurantiaca]MDN4165494.1 M28 family peptidase [Shiella aurantiaca]